MSTIDPQRVQRSDESGLRLAVEAVVPREARALPRRVVALPTAAADVGLVVRRLDLLHVRPVRPYGVGKVVELGVDGGQREAVELGGATVAAGPPLDLQQVLVSLDLSFRWARGGGRGSCIR